MWQLAHGKLAAISTRRNLGGKVSALFEIDGKLPAKVLSIRVHCAPAHRREMIARQVKQVE
jgi:hypothetical protein